MCPSRSTRQLRLTTPGCADRLLSITSVFHYYHSLESEKSRYGSVFQTMASPKKTAATVKGREDHLEYLDPNLMPRKAMLSSFLVEY